MRLTTNLLCLSFALIGFARADLVIGAKTSLNVFPFGDNYVGEYQQVLSSTAFASAVDIYGIRFASSSPVAGSSHTLTVTIGLSTTSASLASLSTNYAANKGADFPVESR